MIATLERQVDVAPTAEVHTASLLRLAELHERIFVKPERAAVALERAIERDPTNGPALEALERCYRATRAWSELARVMEARAAAATGRAERLQRWLEVADVFETKLADAPSALRVYRQIAQLDGRSTEALGAIARLCEKAEDWSGVVVARKRLAELATTAEAKARMHVAIGETLARHEPKQARSHFERAAAIDPSCAAAWNALIEAARGEGAIDRVAEYLEQRVAHTEAPRLRAELLVGLADARAALGDDVAAEAAEEDAIVVDPGNEVAARRVLPRYVAAERWAEALPLCERLANAAVRDGDEEGAYAQRRAMIPIALALEDTARALSAALGAYELRPLADAAEALIDVTHRARTDAAFVARAEATLEAITAARSELPAASLAKLGEIAFARGAVDTALALFREALAGDPCCFPALTGLTESAREPAACAEAAELTIQAAANADERSERFRLLVKAGELLAFGAHDLAAAGAAFEEARALVPRDHRVLHTLVWIYSEIEEWGYLTDVLRSVADSETEPVRRAKGTYAMALVLRDKVGDMKRAASGFEQVLDLDPTRLEAFERLVRLHTEQRDWDALAKAYERMILRTPAEEVDRKHALFFQLGLVYRDRVGDGARGLQAFHSAAHVKPGDATTRKALVELLVIAGQTTEAADVVRAAITLRPDDTEACVELCDVAMRLGAVERAWRALDASQSAGGELRDEEERFHRDYALTPLSVAKTAVAPADWKRLFHPKLDPYLSGILACATRAVLRTPRVQATRDETARALGTPLHRGAEGARIVGMVRRGALLLGAPPPLLYACKTSAPLDGIPSTSGLLVSLEACSALGDAPLSFLIGKHLAAGEPEILAAAVFPTIPELTALLSAAPRPAGRARGPDEGPFDRIVRESLTPAGARARPRVSPPARARGTSASTFPSGSVSPTRAARGWGSSSREASTLRGER